MTVVNDVGVDPNRLLEHPHTVALLQFVCGLGPRKASFLLKVRNFLFYEDDACLSDMKVSQ